ncbi:sugar transporter SWEET1-like [Actinia tenebrosa]|uniref:Sugar transporter SWEET n=1 Tax=Actinia tenebrosa TaxID=6105 RepID=A0A6P8IPV0_ACTTE|nr:sugar transporter SWEET1-like [Actinia tenebrosa]
MKERTRNDQNLNMVLLDILSWMATLATIGFYLTGLIDCKEIIDRQSAGTTPFLPFLTTHFCCGLWLCYGFIKADPTVKFVNAAGLGLSAIYMVCYISYSNNKSRQFTLVILTMAVAMGIEYYLTRIIKDKRVRADYLGLACIITTMLMQASPLFTVVTVLKTKSTETMQYFFSLMMTVVSLIWFTYGFVLQDSTIMAPNISGVLLGLIQLSMFLVFPSKQVAAKKAD